MQLTPHQLDALYDQLAPKLGYLMKLERRLIEVGATDQDELLVLVRDAQEGLHRLCVGIHYLACGKIMGREGDNETVARPADADTKPNWITRREA